MKRLALLFAVILLLPGCDATKKALSVFQKANPEIVPVGVDEDGDAIADVFVQTQDGKVLVDTEGKPLEVVGTREALALAKADDSLISEELIAIAAVIGIPGGTYLGKLWGRVKPAQRAQLWQANYDEVADELDVEKKRFREVVTSVQVARNSDPKLKDAMNAAVGRISSDTKNAITDLKAELPSARAVI